MENKTDKELLNSNDENEILSVLRDYIYEGNEYFEQKKKTFRYCQNIRNSVVHPDYPLAFKYFLPLARKAILQTKADSIQQQFSNKPFFGGIRAKNESKDRVEAKLIQKLLTTNLYDFNRFYAIIDKVEEEKLVYGTGVIKDTWKYRTREIRHALKENFEYKQDIDNINNPHKKYNNQTEQLQNNIQQMPTENGENPALDIENNLANNQNINETENYDTAAQSSIIEYDETIKSDIEVIEDANCLSYVSIWNIVFDPTASTKDNCRYIYERRYFDRDEIKEMFENADEYANYKTQKDAANIGTQNFDFDQKDGTSTNEEERRNTMTEILEIYAYDKLFWTDSDGTFLFIPKNTTNKTRFWNPYNHCQYPYSLVYYMQDNYSIYGKGMIDDEGLGDLNLAANNLFNLAIEGIFSKAKAPIGINSNFCNPAQVRTAMSKIGGMFELLNNPQSVNQIMLQPKLDYNSQELFNAFQALDGYIQTFSNQTNFQTGGTDVKGYNQTLGGIQMIMQSAKQKISYSNKINQDELKELVYRCISNIFQFTKENQVVEIYEDDGLSYYELTTKYNNYKATTFTGILNKDKKIYSLDEVAKLKYTVSIDFATDDGNKVIRNQKLQMAMTAAMQLLPLGIDPMPIVTEYFETLNIHNVFKDKKKEEAKIKMENWKFIKALNDANILLNNGKINKQQYDYLLANAIEPPAEEDIDEMHLEKHNPDMIEHNNIHRKNLAMKEQITQALQQQMSKQQNQEQPQFDRRQAVSVAGQGAEMPNPNADIVAGGVM